jgi:hypothetical protein
VLWDHAINQVSSLEDWSYDQNAALITITTPDPRIIEQLLTIRSRQSASSPQSCQSTTILWQGYAAVAMFLPLLVRVAAPVMLCVPRWRQLRGSTNSLVIEADILRDMNLAATLTTNRWCKCRPIRWRICGKEITFHTTEKVGNAVCQMVCTESSSMWEAKGLPGFYTRNPLCNRNSAFTLERNFES